MDDVSSKAWVSESIIIIIIIIIWHILTHNKFIYVLKHID